MLKYCYDLDGVICEDPMYQPDTLEYLLFLTTAKLLRKTNNAKADIVTGRTEEFRRETELWLKCNGVAYDNLIMKSDSLKGVEHTPKFKADYYKNNDSHMFLESCKNQAVKIAELSGKPVYCVETKKIYI